MSESIITAETLLEADNEQKVEAKQDVENSPDAQDENLESKEILEDNVNADGDVQDKSDEEAPATEVSEDEETVQTDSQETEETKNLEEKSEGSELPKWAKKRLQRQERKHEREMNELREHVKQHVGSLSNQNVPVIDPATQIQNPFTGNVVDINSVEGQVASQLLQLAQVQEQQEKQQHTEQIRSDFKKKLDRGYDKFEDFEDTVTNAGISSAMLEAASLSENADELLYNLAKYKPDEIDRISKLSPERQFREMVLIETKMKQSAKKKIVKKVPEPPSKIKGSGASIKDESDLTFEELLNRRRTKQRERLGR